MKCSNICIIGIPEGEEEDQGTKKPVWKSNDGKLLYIDERKCHTNPGRTEGPSQEEPKEAQARNITFKMTKFQDKENLKDSKGKTGGNIQGSPD